MRDLCDDVTVDDVIERFYREKTVFRCLARARANMKNTKKTVHNCCNSCETFVQFEIFTYYTSYQFFYHIWKNYKIGLEEKGGEGGVRSPLFLLWPE